MSNNDPRPETEAEGQMPDDAIDPSVENDSAPNPAAEGDVSDAEIEAELERELGMEDEVLKWKDMATRAAAELDNYRKRMAREKMDAIRYANQRLLEELLPVIDNFEMGMMAASQDQSSMIYQGMAMVQKQLGDFLSSQNVEEVQAEGQMFDPNLHDALSQQENAEVEEGTILQVMRKGYRLGDRLIRPANVIVAKAPEASEGGDGQ